MKLTLGQIADWIHAEGDFASHTEALGYSIDSRSLSSGDLFFAVRGDRFDGHHFVAAALANGAVAAVVGMGWLAPDDLDPCQILRVPEDSGNCPDCVLNALQVLARHVRRRWGKRLIGVTGSAGKTTTKEAIAQVLAAQFNVLKSEGNLNNGFGLPLQLLKLEPAHQVAVLEMGMNHAGEIAALARIAEPDWAVVSNVAPVHLEHFADGIEGIARAKYELVEALPPTGLAILNADDPHVATFPVRSVARHHRVLFYGLAATAQVRAEDIVDEGFAGLRFTAVVGGEEAAVKLYLLGRHNISNALAALAVGVESGMTLAAAAAALAGMLPGDRRGEIVEYHGARIVNDCYNSNPRALDAMADALAATAATRHIVVAGEMLELGPEGPALHAACGRHIASLGIDLVVGVRGLAQALVDAAREAGANAVFFSTNEETADWLKANLQPGDAVLMKASRGVRLERALALLLTVQNT